MRRREFITAVAGAAAWPLVAQSQAAHPLRRVGALYGVGKDPATEANYTAFRQALHEAGWVEGHNIQIEVRWAGGDLERVRTLAAELLSFNPDIIFTSGIRALNEQRRISPTVPIVFVATTDPVGQGFAQSLARPGGTTTGFLLFEFSVLGKLLDAFKEVVPQASRVALFINPDNRSTGLHAHSFEAAARALGLAPTVISIRTRAEIEPALQAFAAESPGGVILPPDVFMLVHRDLIAGTAAAHRLPLLSAQRHFVRSGGLLSYGVEERALHRQAASYVSRILRGANPGDLPIQAPSSFELVINLKTANALGLTIPPTLLARADEVIE